MTRINLNISPPVGCGMFAEQHAGTMVIIKHLQSRIKHLESELTIYRPDVSSHTNNETNKHEYLNCSSEAKVLPNSCDMDVISQFRELTAGTLVLVEHLQSKIGTLENELCILECNHQADNSTLKYTGQMGEHREISIESHIDVAVNNSISGLKCDSILDVCSEYEMSADSFTPEIRATNEKSTHVDNQMEEIHSSHGTDKLKNLAMNSDSNLSNETCYLADRQLDNHVQHDLPGLSFATLEDCGMQKNEPEHHKHKPPGGSTTFSPQGPRDTTHDFVCKPGGPRAIHTIISDEQ